MAVKVIKVGADPSVVKQVICRQCGATLEYVPIDVKKYEGRDYSGGPDGHTWIDCPNCSNKVILTSW